MAFPKYSCLGQMGHLGPRMAYPASQLWFYYKDCFTILQNKGVKRDMEIILIVFLKEILFKAI